MKCPAYLIILALVLLSSCETARQFAVETITPAEAVYPISSPRVVIVNNAVTQPAANGVELYIGNKQPNARSLDKDTAYRHVINCMADALQQTDYFDEVFVYNYPTREDGLFLSASHIRKDTASRIAEDVNADALLTVDRLLFHISQRIIGSDSYFSSIELMCEGIFGLYLTDKDEVTQSFTLSDTLKFNSYVGSDTALIFNKLPQHLLLLSAERIAEKAARKFAPFWEYSERKFYTGLDSQMRAAFAYANNKRWPQAIEAWTRIYNSGGNNKRKGKAAVNIAVAEELCSSYTAALSWVDKALEAYGKENPEKVREELQYAADYKKKLEVLRAQVLN